MICGVTLSTEYGGSNALITTKTNNLNKKVLEGNIDSSLPDDTTLYLYFTYWNPGCYVHKIWVE